jgi:hypothetical protein
VRARSGSIRASETVCGRRQDAADRGTTVPLLGLDAGGLKRSGALVRARPDPAVRNGNSGRSGPGEGAARLHLGRTGCDLTLVTSDSHILRAVRAGARETKPTYTAREAVTRSGDRCCSLCHARDDEPQAHRVLLGGLALIDCFCHSADT